MIKTISTTIIVTVIGFTITACCFITKDTDCLWGLATIPMIILFEKVAEGIDNERWTNLDKTY